MKQSRKICVITGTRAEYGLLSFLLREIADAADLHLQLVVTGMHLAPEFGMTCKEIVADDVQIDEKVEMLLSSDTPVGIAKSMGLGMIGFADALARIDPDIILVLGDRFEAFSAAVTAMACRIPIAHIHGGETTEGAIDEAMRHSITKMAHLHFTATEEYRRRVIQLGEDPPRVFNVGAIGIDNMHRLSFLSRDDLEREINFSLGPRNLMITFHPVTLEHDTAGNQFAALLQVLEELPDTHLIFTKANADANGRVINAMIDAFVAKHPITTKAFASMGQLRYLSALRFMDGVVGNSSSGLLEAPSLKVGTVNIGDRQRGRIRAQSVIDCTPESDALRKALSLLFSDGFRKSVASTESPYGDGGAIPRIIEVLRTYPLDGILKKQFYDLPGRDSQGGSGR